MQLHKRRGGCGKWRYVSGTVGKAFLEAQGYDIVNNVVYQNNQSAMKLKVNGRRSSTKNTRYMEI